MLDSVFQPLGPDQPTTPPAGNRTAANRGGEVRGDLAPLIPGLRAHPCLPAATAIAQTVPGFGAQPYRDFGHTALTPGLRGYTGIWATPVPGLGARVYREAGHTGTGISGTVGGPGTGIRDTYSLGKRLKQQGIRSRNCVPNNQSQTSTTGGGRFSGGGGE